MAATRTILTGEPQDPPSARRADAGNHSWVTQHGGRWLREFQAGYAHA